MAKKLFKKYGNHKIIKIKNTSITIEPYNIGDSPSLERSLCVWNDVYHKLEIVGFDYNEDERTLFLPRSLSINKLEKDFNTIARSVHPYYDPISNIGINMKLPPRDDIQELAIDFLSHNGKYKRNRQYARLMLCLDTNMGKTYCTIASVAKLKLKTAIILHDTALIERWVVGITQFTDCKEDEIYILKGRKSINDILSNPSVLDNYKFILASHRTIMKYASDKSWNAVTELFKKLKIGIKVFDECHKEFKNIIQIDLHTNTKNTFYLTATAERSSVAENQIFTKVFKNVPVLEFKNKIREKNYINMNIIQYNSHPNQLDEYNCKTMKGFSMNAYMKYCIENKQGQMHFTHAIDVFLNSIKPTGRVIIMVGLIDATKFIKDYIIQNRNDISPDEVGVYCSAISKAEKEDTIKNKRIIITTFKSLGTGVDMPDIKYLCMAEPYSSKVTAKQCCGRIRQSGIYVELVDIGFKDCRRQFNSRLKTLLEKSNKFNIYII